MKPLNPNSMIQGRYLIVQPIGKGGMGEVYLAVDQRLGSAVALKRTFFSEDSTLGTAFEREARILARLRHPVLPKVIDHFAENGDQFLVMEHISGDDIAKRMEAGNKAFPLSWVMFWADQMLDALAYLHSHEPPIVHRDIKPQNLKLTDDNHIVLLDFGLSKDFDSKSSGLNSASVAGYSPHFASMEQIRGTGTDARSDLYSLAATLYQMLTNVIPPDALTRADALLGGKVDPIKPLNELNPEITTAISDVILKAVSIRQDERFSTAVEMQKALRRAFNKDKSDADEKPVMVVSGNAPPPIEKAAVKPDPGHGTTISDTPEMETQIRMEAPTPLDATLQIDIKPDSAAKQSELKTAIFTPSDLKVQTIPTASESPQVESASAVQTSEPPPEVAAVSVTDDKGAAQSSRQVASAMGSSRPNSASPANKSKTGLIVGILALLLIIGAVGAGAAWYFMKRPSNAGMNSVPTPTPVASSTPNSTPQVATNTETPNPVVTNPANNEPSNSSPASTSPTTVKPGTPGPTKDPAAKTNQPAVNKAAPKPKPKGNEPPILQ